VTATFSQPMDPQTITSSRPNGAFAQGPPGTTCRAVAMNTGNTVAIFRHPRPLSCRIPATPPR
jgi:hypothetical protein